jgi:hypothetical protein
LEKVVNRFAAAFTRPLSLRCDLRQRAKSQSSRVATFVRQQAMLTDLCGVYKAAGNAGGDG